MFTKRPDKYTTGLINLRNDCFANLLLQAYLALPGLTEYLNSFIGTFRSIQALVPDDLLHPSENKELLLLLPTAPDAQSSTSGTSGSSDKSETAKSTSASTSASVRGKTPSGIPLHVALARILHKLQETQLTSRTVSVWTFLHELERIFNAKILRSQHDAQELTQLINETLEAENLWLRRQILRLSELSSLEVSAVVLEQLSLVEVPDFPMNGLTLNQMKCLSCLNTLKPLFVPFLMMTLHTPEKSSTELRQIIDDNEKESIDGYQCLCCRVRAIVANEKRMGRAEPEAGSDLEKVFDLASDSGLFINEDLSPELENFIKEYKKDGVSTADITLTVLRTNQILKPPKILGIHLLRSLFNGVSVTRNACRVTFKDLVSLLIGSEFHDDLQQLQKAALEVQRPIMLLVLTTDVNDMEDESVQLEDIDEKASDNDEDGGTTDDDLMTVGDATVKDDDTDDTLDASDTSLTTSQELEDATVASTDVDENTLNKAPISKEQSRKLRKHFRAFKFNENDEYKYRLKAVIRHQGSHTQGHYECYKKKPLFVKDKEGTTFKLAPEIALDLLEDSTEAKDLASDGTNSASGLSLDGLVDIHGEFRSSNGNFRRRFSNMMGSRPSIVLQQTQDENIQELIDSSLATPHELIVDNSENNGEQGDYLSRGQPIQKPKKVKMTKIPSLIKNPYWRISDSQVVETSRSLVLLETTAVYMLYYERVDRKQIRK